MPTRKEGLLVLYPEYFDRSRSRAQGRRVRRDAAVDSPTAKAIFRAATAVGLDPQLQTDHHHSGNWLFRNGRVLVRKADAGRKEQLLERIATALPAAMGEETPARQSSAPKASPTPKAAPTGRPDRKRKRKRRGGFAKRRRG